MTPQSSTRRGSVFVWCVVLLSAAWLLSVARPLRVAGDYDLTSFAKLPVSGEGRVKPFDTVARTSLLVISGKQTLTIDDGSKAVNGKVNADEELDADGNQIPKKNMQQPAIRWLADVIARPEKARDYPIFRVDHPDVLKLLDLKPDEGGRNRLSFNRVMQHREAIADQARLAAQVKSKERNPYQRHLTELYNHLNLYLRLERMETPYAVAPMAPGQQWQQLSTAFEAFQRTGEVNPSARAMAELIGSYRDQKPDAFNAEVTRYGAEIAEKLPGDCHRARFEVFFNQFAPFYHASVLYVVAFLLGCGGLLMRSPVTGSRGGTMDRAALSLLMLTLIVHTFGLAARIYIQGRPPVTNLYSSAVFIGWFCVVLAIVLERVYRMGLGTLVASSIGFVTLIVAHHLGDDGDTMEMMQAVLDSNFWLSTHVVAVTTGYSATFLSGALGAAYILLGVFTRKLSGEQGKALPKMIYAVVCFALLLSFVGTVLGGIWADQSWGRFWGWDPKENGAALIVLINAIILHARWGGMIRDRGVAVLAVAGNIVTAWSWFGTNMLGIGLHAYGFMESAMFYLILFVLSQVVVMAIGLLPRELWRSFRTRADVPVAEQPEAAGA